MCFNQDHPVIGEGEERQKRREKCLKTGIEERTAAGARLNCERTHSVLNSPLVGERAKTISLAKVASQDVEKIGLI